MEIINIIFDFGGVLLTEDDKWVLDAKVKKLTGSNDRELENAWNHAWPDAEKGRVDEDGFFINLLDFLKIKPTPEIIHKLKEIYRKRAGHGGAYPLLTKLFKKYRLFALTNTLSDWQKYKIKKFKLDKYLRLVVSSCDVGIGKPNPKIYRMLIKEAKIKPRESVFIDNMGKNLFPAKRLGFNTVLFENYNQCTEEMRKMGIDI